MSLNKFSKGKRLLASDLNSMIDAIQIIETTWGELKNLRDNSQLIPGATYRITDYTCTTTQSGTQSAGHVFDILVTANDVNVLNENAHAIQHSGDTYFANSDLSSWELKYCLDNDTTRFAWARKGGEMWTMTSPDMDKIEMTQVSTNDTTYEGHPYKFTFFMGDMAFTLYVAHLELQDGEETIPNVITLDGMEPMVNQIIITSIVYENQPEGHGVVYYMKDEFNNECPYDFKNIQYQRYKITACDKSPNLVGQYSISGTDFITVDTSTPYYCYTFSVIDNNNGVIDDVSVIQNKYKGDEGYCYKTYGNVIKDYYNSDNHLLKYYLILSNNVFVTDTDIISTYLGYSGYYSNTFGNNCNNNTFGNNCYRNTIGNNCNNNTFVTYCFVNTFGNECHDNIFGNRCYNNTFGNECVRNTFGNECYNNTFGNECYNNIFGNRCGFNTFENSCYFNTFGNNCYRNTIGNEFNNNRFGNDCNNNTFGNLLRSNTFGNEFNNNTFGNEFNNNTFGNGCNNNTFGNYFKNNTFGNYFKNNTFGNECYNNTFGNDYIQYCTFFDGVQYINVSITTSNSNYLQYMQVLNGTKGTINGKLQITGSTYVTAGRAYTTTIGKNSSGTLTSKVPMDA